MAKTYLFTSESVSEGHPDKVADQISDAVLDYFLFKDKHARVAIETLVTTNKVVLAGEVKTNFVWNKEDINNVAKNAIKTIGYQQEGFDYNTVSVDNYIHAQSADIAIGVDETDSKPEGAGDQGIMFGYACNETDVFMPMPIFFAHKILLSLSNLRKQKPNLGLLPDAKSQVTIEYKDNIPVKIHTVVVSHQHEEKLSLDNVKNIILPLLKEILPSNLYNPNTCIHHINPTGRFVIGGPDGDTGITGRKIIVDTYGGSAPHGGGAFSGKDPTKVDRSSAYIARYLAKNIVAAGLSTKCTIQLSYAIGVAQPLSVYVNTHGCGVVEDEKIAQAIVSLIDLSPKGIRLHLKLNNPIYQATATYGHFGRENINNYFTWEALDLVEALKSKIYS